MPDSTDLNSTVQVSYNGTQSSKANILEYPGYALLLLEQLMQYIFGHLLRTYHMHVKVFCSCFAGQGGPTRCLVDGYNVLALECICMYGYVTKQIY